MQVLTVDHFLAQREEEVVVVAVVQAIPLAGASGLCRHDRNVFLQAQKVVGSLTVRKPDCTSLSGGSSTTCADIIYNVSRHPVFSVIYCLSLLSLP